jgi:hypothetical protein
MHALFHPADVVRTGAAAAADEACPFRLPTTRLFAEIDRAAITLPLLG